MFSLRRRPQTPRRPHVRVEKTSDPRPKAIKLLMDLRPDAQRAAPGPSKFGYRLSRAWKKSWVRCGAQFGLPLALLIAIGAHLATDPEVHAALDARRVQMIDALSARPEFAVTGTRITGASDALRLDIIAALDLGPNTSSINLDVVGVQARVSALNAVKSAHVMLDPEGVLKVVVDERVPEVLWRDGAGDLWLLDRDGYAVDLALERIDYPDLPVIIGQGAPDRVDEALSLYHTAPDLQGRLRAIIRVGQRRWNIALDRDLTIMLPEQQPAQALARVMALHYGEEILDRDLVAIDMRLGERPTLRMSRDALEIYRLRDAVAGQTGKDT